MDLLKAKIYLDKINREFTRMLKDPDNVPRIDVDITLSYVRELYDAFLTDTAEPARTAAPKKAAPVDIPPPPAPAPPPPPVVVAPPPPPVVVAPPPPPVVVAPPPPPVVVAPPPPPVVVAPPPPAPEPAPAPVVAHVPPPPPPEPAPAPPAAAPASDHKHHAADAGAAEVLFEYKEAKELSEKLSETPISDLKRSIALNDKLLLTRELFGGDNNAFDQTLTALNGFSGFEQAKSYLINNCIGTYEWLDKKKAETAKGFIRLVRRRYK